MPTARERVATTPETTERYRPRLVTSVDDGDALHNASDTAAIDRWSAAAVPGRLPVAAPRPARGASATRAAVLLGMQQSLGNRAVQRFLQRTKAADVANAAATLPLPATAAVETATTWGELPVQRQEPDTETLDTEDAGDTGDTSVATAATTADDGTDDPKRMAIVMTAKLEATDAVHAKNVGDADDTGRTTRPGWEQLLKYFHEAAPNLWSDDVIKYNAKPGMNGLPHWCGIFALWALRTSGMGVGTWKMGSGISAVSGIKPVSKQQVKVGDIGYLDSAQHHFIVAGVSSDRKTIETVDGNSGSTSEVTAGNSKQVANVAGFFTAF